MKVGIWKDMLCLPTNVQLRFQNIHVRQLHGRDIQLNAEIPHESLEKQCTKYLETGGSLKGKLVCCLSSCCSLSSAYGLFRGR